MEGNDYFAVKLALTLGLEAGDNPDASLPIPARW